MTCLGKLQARRTTHLRQSLGLLGCLLVWSLAPAQTGNMQAIRTHYERAQDALRTNNPASAAHEFNEILRLDPNNAEARASLGLIAYNQRDYAEASRQFEASLQLKPALWNAEAFWGLSEEHLGHRNEARTHLERAFPRIEQKSLRVQVGLELVGILKDGGDVSKAVSVLEVLRRTEGTNPDVAYTAYRTYSDLAARALADLADAAPASARMHQILAQTLMSRDNFPGAIQEYEAALKADLALPGIHFELGQAILANAVDEVSRAKAQNEFKAAISANPGDADSEYELGEIAWLKSDRQKAKSHYSRALELRPHFINAQLGLAKVLAATDQAKEALAYLLDAERSDPRNEMVHYSLVSVYRKLGRNAEANREWAAFQDLRNSKTAVRSLYEEILQRSVTPK